MRRNELKLLEMLEEEPSKLGRLADEIGKSKSWVSELLSDLRDRNLIEKKGNEFELSESYSSALLARISDRFDLSKVLAGKKEEILKEILGEPKGVERLEKEGYSSSTLYQHLRDLQEIGVIEKTPKGFKIVDEPVKDFIKAEIVRDKNKNEYTAADQKIIKTKGSKQVEGQPTAFSAMARYGIDFYPNQDYRYQGNKKIKRCDVLIHSVKFAEDKKQTAIAGIFYLKHKEALDNSKLWKLANKWGCVEKWADLLAFIDQRSVKNKDLFLSWAEFSSLAQEYDLYLDKKHPNVSLSRSFTEAGEALDSEVQAFLLGGANLILRGMKDSTKDIDVVLKNKQDFSKIVQALKEVGYSERKDLSQEYQKMNPHAVLEKRGFPRWDLFVKEVAKKLYLTSGMEDKSQKYREFEELELRLLSLTDILLFKSITDREGDLEDAGLIIRESKIDWKSLLSEIKQQEELTGKHFSIDVLETCDILQKRYQIKIPVKNKLVSRSLERALLLALEQGPKTSKELKELLNFPGHKIYNKLRKLEEKGEIQVDRTGKLNKYSKSS